MQDATCINPGWFLGRELPLEMEMATQSSILAWRIPWIEPGGLQCMGLQRAGYDWATKQQQQEGNVRHSLTLLPFFLRHGLLVACKNVVRISLCNSHYNFKRNMLFFISAFQRWKSGIGKNSFWIVHRGNDKQEIKPESFAINFIFIHSFVYRLPCAWSWAGHQGSVSWLWAPPARSSHCSGRVFPLGYPVQGHTIFFLALINDLFISQD